MQHADIRRLENLAANAWPAEAVEILGSWTMQFDHGVTRRANSVLPTGWSGELSLDDAVAAVERRYPAHSLRPCFKITDAALPTGLDDRLGDRGYRREGHSLVLAAPVSAVNAPARSSAEIELLETKGLAFEPDVVVLVFVENDFDNFNREAFPLGGTIAVSVLAVTSAMVKVPLLM